MPSNAFKVFFLIGLIASETIRFPHRRRNRQAWRRGTITDQRIRVSDFVMDMIAFAGMEIIPLIYVFAGWPALANYALPSWMGWAGAIFFAGGLWLLWRAHGDLGRNWSPTLQIMEGHALVTRGVYGRIRHPIYAAIWLMIIGQALLLHNWIAGMAGWVLFLPVYLIRTPREERMMLEHFGDEYRDYLSRTGRIFPRFRA